MCAVWPSGCLWGWNGPSWLRGGKSPLARSGTFPFIINSLDHSERFKQWSLFHCFSANVSFTTACINNTSGGGLPGVFAHEKSLNLCLNWWELAGWSLNGCCVFLDRRIWHFENVFLGFFYNFELCFCSFASKLQHKIDCFLTSLPYWLVKIRKDPR